MKQNLKDPWTYIGAAGLYLGGDRLLRKAKSGTKNVQASLKGKKTSEDLVKKVAEAKQAALALSPVHRLPDDKTAGVLGAIGKYGKSVAGWAGFGAGSATFGDAEGRQRDGTVKTFLKHLKNPKLWLASAAVIPAMGAYGKVHDKALTHLAGKGGKIGKTASFFKNNKIGSVIDPTGASMVSAMGYGMLGVPTPYNTVMNISDPEHKIWSGLKGKFWDPNKKYKSPVADDSF